MSHSLSLVFLFCLCFTAYENRQHTKRQQISSRSWFSPSSSGPSGSAVGNLLNKLGQKGRDAAAAKAVNAAPSSSLVRRRSDGGLTSRSTQESVSSPDVVAASDVQDADSSPVQRSEDRQDTYRPSTDQRVGKPAPEVHYGTGHNSTESCSTLSLVADYSDSDSDSGQ